MFLLNSKLKLFLTFSLCKLNSCFRQAHELPDPLKEPLVVEIPQNINNFIDDPLFTYQDFSRRGAENVPSTFRVQDYSWDDHGFSLVNRLYNDVGHLLDLKFRAAYNLTYFTMADKTNVDTSKFRRAIWNYIQCIYGIRHDDYDYGEVNQVNHYSITLSLFIWQRLHIQLIGFSLNLQLLERSLKMFIKTACCFPERITKKDYDSILTELKHSEKVIFCLYSIHSKQ